MSLRAIIGGIIFGLFITFVVYFNDQVIRQTMLVGNHFPVIVFGVIILLVLVLNPLLGRLRVVRPLGRLEIAVIGALGLAVCGWPGSGFMRTFSGLTVCPTTLVRSNVSWKAARVMSYVPGASYLLAEGHVREWSALAQALDAQRTSEESSAARRIWQLLPSNAQTAIQSVVAQGAIESSGKAMILSGLNDVLSKPELYDEASFPETAIGTELRKRLEANRAPGAKEKDIQYANRMLLAEAFPEFIAAPPRGKGALLADNDPESPAVEALLLGKEGDKRIGLFDIPWATWMPTIILWGSLAVLIGLCSVCLAVIFQPQWKRELLAFPLVRFVSELTQSDRPDGVASVVRNRLFWYGFGAMIILHLINGIHEWIPNFIEIPLQFNFEPLTQLFPTARQVRMSWYSIWSPRLFPTVIAIAFFLSADVAFSLGMSGYIHVAIMSLIISSGVTVDCDAFDTASENMIRVGTYLGVFLMFLFAGRRYYANVAASALGFRRHAHTPPSAMWAARILAGCILLSVLILSRYGVNWFLGLPFILIILMLFSVMTRVNAETGSFFMQAYWAPIGLLTALLGMKAIGPTAYVVMGFFCLMMATDAREIVMPFVANALYMGTDLKQESPKSRLVLLVGGMVVVGFFAALAFTLFFQYNHGINAADLHAVRNVPTVLFDHLTVKLSELAAYDDLSESVFTSGLGKLGFMQPNWSRLGWLAGGFVVVIMCSVARLKLSWWPLHPVAFIVFGTYPGAYFTPSFLLGWLIKAGVLKMSGAKGFRMVKPLMIGVIGGELFAAIGWSIFGTIYYLITDLVPKSIRIFPG